MRFRRTLAEPEDPIELNLIPLIDIIMFLLIFFISTTSFIEEPGVQVEKPKAATAKQTAKNSIIFAVTPEGKVAYAAPFSGFGTLVIVDHGSSAFTLYGHLQEALVTAGTNVSRGAPLGRIGLSPSGGAALYFELRIDGRPVDPIQWLSRRRE